MKSTQRHAAAVAGLFALVLMSAPAIAAAQPQPPAQRGGPAGPDTKRILVATWKSDDRALGVQVADAVRKRLQDEYGMKQLWVVTKREIDGTLEQSGYKPDSALSQSDLMELGKQVRGDYVLDGVASKATEGVRVEPKLLLKRQQNTLSQPLPTVTAKNAGDAAKEVHRAFAEALKSMAPYIACESNLRAQKYDAAIADGRAVLVAYPASTLGRLCLLSAFNYSKAAPDSIIRVANEVLAVDPTSLVALSYAADAYNAKGDKDKAIETMVKLWRADPSNAPLADGIINALGQSGAPDKALPIIDEMIVNNPGDPKLLNTKWKLLLGAKKWKDALAAGDELAKINSSVVTVDFFNRQLGAAQSDSNTAAINSLAARAAQKFPKEFQMFYAQQLRKSGQLQQALVTAQRAVDADPKTPNGWLFIILTHNDLNRPDSVVATAQKAIAAGADKDAIGQVLITLIGPAIKKAQDTKARADWGEALKTAQMVDGIAPSAQTKFYIAVSSFSIAADVVNGLQPIVADIQKTPKNATPANKAKACEEAKIAEDALATASVAMPAGAKHDMAVAGQIMGAIQGYIDYVANVKKAFCPK